VARERILRHFEDDGSLAIESDAMRSRLLDDPGGDALDGVVAAVAVFRAYVRSLGLNQRDIGECGIEGRVYV
jgi:hypothetical protein